MVANQLIVGGGSGGGGGSGTASTAASSSPTAILDYLMDALSMTTSAVPTASENSPCFHGSTSDHFPDGRTYRYVIEYYLSVPPGGERTKFVKGHPEDFHDLYFAQYIFALCTSWYLKTKQTPFEMKDLLTQAIYIKYSFEPLYSKYIGGGPGPDQDKLNRYLRAIMCDERGIVNCLSRETKAYCDCMKDKKREVKGMERTEFCVGCKIYFPRDGMMKCNGCNYAMFCTEGCHGKNWPKHQEQCEIRQDLQNMDDEIITGKIIK